MHVIYFHFCKTKRKEKTAQQHQDVALNKEARYTLQERKMMKRYVMSDSQILTGKVSEDRDKRDVTVSQQPETERGREGNGLLHPSRSPFTAVTCLIIKDRVRCLARCCSSNCTLYTREWWRVPARKAENLTECTTPLVTERLYCFAFIWPLISSHRCIRQGVSELRFKVFLLSSHYTPPSRFDKPAINQLQINWITFVMQDLEPSCNNWTKVSIKEKVAIINEFNKLINKSNDKK